MARCEWVGDDPLYINYHDKEWGVPVYDDYELFQHLILDGQQAGLSWIIILKKRENYYKAFDNLIPEKIVSYNKKKIEELMQDKGIIRNRLKIQSIIKNSKGFLDIQNEGSFSDYLWGYVGGKPIINQYKTIKDIPTETEASKKMSKDLKKRGFSFVGPTICYAFMQAVGMVNDHTLNCFRHQELS